MYFHTQETTFQSHSKLHTYKLFILFRLNRLIVALRNALWYSSSEQKDKELKQNGYTQNITQVSKRKYLKDFKMKKLLLGLTLLSSISALSSDCDFKYNMNYSKITGESTPEYKVCEAKELYEYLEKNTEEIRVNYVFKNIFEVGTTYTIETSADQKKEGIFFPGTISLYKAGNKAQDITLNYLSSFCERVSEGSKPVVIDELKGNYKYQTHAGRPNMQQDSNHGGSSTVSRRYLVEVECRS